MNLHRCVSQLLHHGVVVYLGKKLPLVVEVLPILMLAPFERASIPALSVTAGTISFATPMHGPIGVGADDGASKATTTTLGAFESKV